MKLFTNYIFSINNCKFDLSINSNNKVIFRFDKSKILNYKVKKKNIKSMKPNQTVFV